MIERKGNAYRIHNWVEFKELDDKYIQPSYVLVLVTDKDFVSVLLPRTAIRSIITRTADEGYPVIVEIEADLLENGLFTPIFTIETYLCDDVNWEERD